ncbi:M16 family metallopeptidase [Streptococcus hongkongensis]
MNNQNVSFISKSNCKYAYFSIMFYSGTIIERKNQLGITHLLEHYLLSSGEVSLNCMFEEIGFLVTGSTSREYLNFSAYCSKEDFVDMFLKFQNRIFFPNWNEKYLMLEKKVVMKELVTKNNLQTKIFEDYFWGSDIIGKPETINSITLDELIEFHKEVIKNGYFHINIMGDRELERIFNSQQFSILDIKNKKQVICNRPEFSTGNKIKLTNLNQYNQIIISYELSHIEYTAENFLSLAFITALLTGLKDSKLNSELREKNGIVYQVISYPIIYESILLYQIKSTVERENVTSYLDIVFNLLKTIEFSDDYFNICKRRIGIEIDSQINNFGLELIKLHNKNSLFNFPSLNELKECLNDYSNEDLHDFISKDLFLENKKSIISDS